GLAPLIRVTFVFGGLIALVAIAPTIALAALGLVLVGAGSISVLAIGNSTLQLNTEPTMRGRVMALWTMAFLGSTPIGGPIIGWIGRHAGPRWCLVTGAAACLVAAAYARREATVARRSRTVGESITPAAA